MEEIIVDFDDPYDWEELDGRVLLINSRKTAEGNMVCGVDVNNPERIYILHWDLPNVKKCAKCGGPFTPKNPQQIYCNKKRGCNAKAVAQARWRSKYKK